MKVGVSTLTAYPWPLNELAPGAAEAMQADSFWTIVHVLGFFHPELVPEMTPANRRSGADAFFDPFCACAVLGRATTIPLGIGSPTLRGGLPRMWRARR